MGTTLLIDFSNFVHVCWWPAVAAQEARSKHMATCSQCIGATTGVGTFCARRPAEYDAKQVLLVNLDHKLNTMKKAMEEAAFYEYDIVFVEDDRAEHKYQLLPQYKANRVKGEFDPRPLAKSWLIGFNYSKWAWSPGNEADDAIASIVHSRRQEDSEAITVIASSDKDLWQLHDPPHIFIYGLTSDKFVNNDRIEEKFGVRAPRLIPLVKALWGDSSDNVPNVVPRMQKQLLPLIRVSDGTVGDIVRLANVWGTTKRCQELLTENAGRAQTNMALVKLDPNCKVEWVDHR